MKEWEIWDSSGGSTRRNGKYGIQWFELCGDREQARRGRGERGRDKVGKWGFFCSSGIFFLSNYC